jgi:hypothetical protein
VFARPPKARSRSPMRYDPSRSSTYRRAKSCRTACLALHYCDFLDDEPPETGSPVVHDVLDAVLSAPTDPIRELRLRNPASGGLLRIFSPLDTNSPSAACLTAV